MADSERGDIVPIIDISSLVAEYRGEVVPPEDLINSASQIAAACKVHGFFYIVNHGVPCELVNRLEELSKVFFAKDVETKMRIRMALGGRAWRGYFPVGGELTSGKPDIKEGLYFGTELPEDHPLVLAKTPIHGSNLFPDDIPGFKETVLEYIEKVTCVGHAVMAGIARSLGLAPDYFSSRYTSDPLILFRIFNYPVDSADEKAGETSESGEKEVRWGVGEHTDYGLLTILKQDQCGGLQVKSRGVWIEAPPVKNTFVCNIGDMLDRITHGLYRSTPHRVKNTAGRDRISFPLFFDPNFFQTVPVIDGLESIPGFADDRHTRWDKASVHDFTGTYGDYVLDKVSKVFPQLRTEVL